MKTILSLAVILISLATQAGDKVGNGGGLWVCQNQQTLIRGELVDLYEARTQFNSTLISSSSAINQIVDDRAQFLAISSPSLSQALRPYVDEVRNKMSFIEGELVVIDDVVPQVKPWSQSCPEGIWSYLQFANFTNQGQILIRKDYWDAAQIPAINKAALIWHEAIYHWLRIVKGDTTSIRARRIVGLLFSNLSPSEVQSLIQDAIGQAPALPSSWICFLQSMSTQNVFSASSLLRREAEIETIQACQAAGQNNTCSDFNLQCDQITSEEQNKFCEVENYATGEVYSARGRSAIEATYNVLSTCISSSPTYGSCNKMNVKCQ